MAVMRNLVLSVILWSTGCIDLGAAPAPNDDTPQEFVVPAGATANSLTPSLVASGLVASAWQWKLFLKQHDASCLKAGRFLVRPSMTAEELVDTLCGTPIPEDEPFTVTEGWRIVEIDAALAKKGWIEAGAYAQLARTKAVELPFEVTAPTLEGYLYPETYRVEPDRFDPARFIERQLQMFNDRFLSKHPEGFGERSLQDIVVMASMLEREEPRVDQRPIVAGILWKRLDNNWKLGVDATSRYVLSDWSDRRLFLAQLRDPDDVYNTRLRQGLPPTAIGNAGLSSLEAAVAPESSEWWYYLHDADGVFHGARDGAGHAANRRRYNVY